MTHGLYGGWELSLYVDRGYDPHSVASVVTPHEIGLSWCMTHGSACG
jgi:hypothetical protein